MLDRGPGATTEGPPKYRVNALVGTLTRVACARGAPILPADYAERSVREMRYGGIR